MLRALIFILAFSASANAADLSGYNLQTVNKTDYSLLFWDVYNIELLGESGKYSPDKNYALKLTYKMDLDGADIAERSAQEMRKQGDASEVQIAAWYLQMKDIFPNVHKGTVLLGVKDEANETKFFHDGKEIAHVKDPEFTKAFFGIWLSNKTTEPELRKKLLAGN